MVSTAITKTNGKGKVIDFRDNLTIANIDDYANMHGTGGKNHAPNSTITCCICNYSKGTGENSVTVRTNINIDAVYALFTATQRIITENTLKAGNESTISQSGLNQLKQIYKQLEAAYKASQSTPMTSDAIKKIGNAYHKALGEIKTGNRAGVADFTYSQDKVDAYKKQNDGTAPVSKISIVHCPIRKDGQVSTYPWFIKITNGYAPVVTQNTGATTYDAKKMQVKAEEYINVNDNDMFRMMLRVVRYIETWENTRCIPLLQNGLQKRAEERQAAANNRS